MTKLFRTSTIAASLDTLLKGQLHFLNQYFEVTAISGYDTRLKEVQEREKVKIHSIEMQRNISPFKDFVSLLKLYRYFRKEKPTIVHSITPKAGLLTMLAGKMAGVPIRIHTFTGLIFPSKNGLMQELLIWMDRLLCWSATHIYPEGNGVKNDLINYRITSKPLKVIANGNVNGIDLDFFSPTQVSQEHKERLRQELNISPYDFVFIFVGRLVGDKGINELVEAFCNIKINNLKLLLVGPTEEKLDPLKPETIEMIKNNKNIIPVGFQKDVRNYFAISDALTFPSYREGFPNVVIQAGAMELPSIVSNINGCNEIIQDGKNGLIIPSKNVQELKKSMIKLIHDKELHQNLKQNSRAMIVSRYKQSIVWEAILEEYQKIINNLERN